MAAESVVHVVDDDSAVRDSLNVLLHTANYRVQTHDSASAFLNEYKPDGSCCMLLDLRMPNMDGMELLRELRKMQLPVSVVMMTAYGDIPTAVQAMRDGAVGFIEKPIDSDDLFESVRRCFEHARQTQAGRIKAKRRTARQARLLAQLTDREREVLVLLGKGYMNKHIAKMLGISIRTVEVHRARLREKLKVTSASDLIRIAMSV